MCTEKDNEELIEALVKAARTAFLSLKETTKEHFYFYVFVFDQGLHPYISAWSYEALEKSIIEQQPPDGDGSEYNRALRLNPSSALLSEYLETCE